MLVLTGSIKCLTIVDEFTHECLAIDVASSIRSRRVIGLGPPNRRRVRVIVVRNNLRRVCVGIQGLAAICGAQ